VANSSLCCNLRYHDPAVNWLAHLESSLRKSGGWSGPNSELHSSLHYNVQYHGQVSLDGRYKKDQVYTMLAISLVPEEEPLSGLDSFRATVEAKPHISRELGKIVPLRPVVEAVIADTVPNGTVVEDAVGIVANHL
jgi:hypothetical protein